MTTRGDVVTTAQKQAAGGVASLGDGHGKDQPPRDVVLKGRIDKVCQAKGCWFTIRDTGDRGVHPQGPAVRVTSRGYLFFVPKDLSGRTAYVSGTLTRKKLSAEEAQHFAEDEARAQSAAGSAGKQPGTKAPSPPAQAKGATYEWQLEAVGVAWEG